MKEKCYRYRTPYGVFDCVLQEREKLFYNFFIKDGETVVAKGLYAGYIKDLGLYLKKFFPVLKTYAEGKRRLTGKTVDRKRRTLSNYRTFRSAFGKNRRRKLYRFGTGRIRCDGYKDLFRMVEENRRA